MTRHLCPSCNTAMVDVIGRPMSPFLLVGEFPGTEEIAKGIPFIGRAGEVLKAELTRAGLPFNVCRVTNLWRHEVPAGRGKEFTEIRTRCFDFMMSDLLDQIKKAEVILLMGSDVVPLLTGSAVSKVAGAEVYCKFAPHSRVIASYNPAIALQEGGVVGDLRLAITRFAEIGKPILRKKLGELS